MVMAGSIAGSVATEAGVVEMLVGVGGGAEGSGVITVLAERIQAGSVMTSSIASPTWIQCRR